MMIKSLKKLFFYRQHPEAALRYLPIVALLKIRGLDRLKILEVGSGSYGVTPYLKKKVIGVDTSFPEPAYPLLTQVHGSALALPFTNNEFEVVIMSDVLEHIPAKLRPKAVMEAIRVSERAVIVNGPFGQLAANQDKELADYSQRKLGKMHPFFVEHLTNGLPETKEIIDWSLKNPKVAKTQLRGEFLNLGVRNWLMKWFITENKWQFYFYLKGLMFLVPFLLLCNKKPCYRSLILIELKHGQD